MFEISKGEIRTSTRSWLAANPLTAVGIGAGLMALGVLLLMVL